MFCIKEHLPPIEIRRFAEFLTRTFRFSPRNA
jgi:hypothetical protein